MMMMMIHWLASIHMTYVTWQPPSVAHPYTHLPRPLQSYKESCDDRQHEFAEQLQQYQAQLAAAQQGAEAALARYDAHETAKQQALEQKQAKEEELRNAQQRHGLAEALDGLHRYSDCWH
jgi:hypothetical protein